MPECHLPVSGTRKFLDALDKSSNLRSGESMYEVLASSASPPDQLFIGLILILIIVIIRLIIITCICIIFILPTTLSHLLTVGLQLT